MQLPPYTSGCAGAKQRNRVFVAGPVFRRLDRYVRRNWSRA